MSVIFTHLHNNMMEGHLTLQVHKKQADKASKDEQSRRIEELSHLSEEEIQHRIAVGNKLLEVQKELLSTHTPVKVTALRSSRPTVTIPSHHSPSLDHRLMKY